MSKFLITLLLFLCVFDPADSVFGLKVPVFAITILYCVVRRIFVLKNKRLLNYFCFFSIILPSLSYVFGVLLNGDHYSAEVSYFSIIKPYLFLVLTFVVASSFQMIEFTIKTLLKVLFGLSIATILLFIINLLNVVPFEILYIFGFEHTLYAIGERSFGAFTLNRVYFHTSPMLVFSLCYFLYKYIDNKKISYLLLTIITAFSFFISGTRNNMMMSLLPFVLMLYLNSSKTIKRLLIFISVIVVCFVISNGLVSDFTDKSEASNEAKLSLVPEYLDCYSNPRTLIFGDGIGSFMKTSLRGNTDNNELTYFELLRRFGIIGFLCYVYLMFLPVRKLIKNKTYNWMGLAYFLYLVMIFSNPFYFSSNGMIILSVVLAVYYSQIAHKKKQYDNFVDMYGNI